MKPITCSPVDLFCQDQLGIIVNQRKNIPEREQLVKNLEERRIEYRDQDQNGGNYRARQKLDVEIELTIKTIGPIIFTEIKATKRETAGIF